MTTTERRNKIRERLESELQAVSASALAAEFSVSRQIIVGDIAILRSGGLEIDATPRGYLVHRERKGIQRRIVCVHTTTEQMELELNTAVDYGCAVLDVIVDHPVYGSVKADLNIESRYDVELFIEKISAEDATPLSTLTGGTHIHTLVCDSIEGYNKMVAKLEEYGIIAKSEQ